MRLLSFLTLLVLPQALVAQTTETPIPFDSARHVLSITPVIAERFRLAAPAWPVTGAYQTVRLYTIDPGGGLVLVVERSGGALERLPFSSADRTALGNALDAAMRLAGRSNAETTSETVSEPAGNAFARHQTFLAAIAYGPLAASLVDDGGAAGGLYLLTTGLTFFASYGAAQSTPFTRAQSYLGGSLGLAAGAGGLLVGYAATGNADKGVRAFSLASAIAGTIAGVGLASDYSDGEAHAAGLGIETAAVAGFTLSSATTTEWRPRALTAVVTGALGYPLGLAYQRHAPYTVTAGDVEATSTSALVGTLAASATLGHNPSGRRTAITLGSGYLGGALIGEVAFARDFDLTQSQSNVLNVGALAGALLGAAIPVIAGSDNVSVPLGTGAVGAVLGMSALASTFPATARGVVERTGASLRRSPRRANVELSILPSGLVGLVSRAPGQHALARFVF